MFHWYSPHFWRPKKNIASSCRRVIVGQVPSSRCRRFLRFYVGCSTSASSSDAPVEKPHIQRPKKHLDVWGNWTFFPERSHCLHVDFLWWFIVSSLFPLSIVGQIVLVLPCLLMKLLILETVFSCWLTCFWCIFVSFHDILRGGFQSHGCIQKWLVYTGKSHRSKWMMTRGYPNFRKPHIFSSMQLGRSCPRFGVLFYLFHGT